MAIVATVAVVRHLDRRVMGSTEAMPGKLMPGTLLMLTALTIITGRLLPYTYRHLIAGY